MTKFPNEKTRGFVQFAWLIVLVYKQIKKMNNNNNNNNNMLISTHSNGHGLFAATMTQ